MQNKRKKYFVDQSVHGVMRRVQSTNNEAEHTDIFEKTVEKES